VLEDHIKSASRPGISNQEIVIRRQKRAKILISRTLGK
jgi:hypothetical protein